jgi:hypothetical protein
MKKGFAAILFIVILIIISIFYNYQEIAFKRPQSVHKWRQSDCASIALNYYQGGMHFFNAETNNLTSDAGKSGKCCTSEIPVLYFSVALFYKVFGYHEFIFRILNSLLFFLGLFFLFRLLFYLLKNVFWAIALALLFFSSPVLVYYGNNFLTNSSALAFSIIGWYYFVRFYYESRPKWFYISIIVFFIAASFKVSSLFSLFAISGIYALESFGLVRFNENRKIFNKPVLYLLSILSVFIIIGLWLIHAHNYNLKHDCTYFSTTVFPIWDLNTGQIKDVLNSVRKIWLAEYFHGSVLIFLSISLLFLISNFRKNNKIFAYSILFIIAEAIGYIILQFWTFADHDYYVIDIYILPILIIISTFDLLKSNYQRIFNSLIAQILFSVFLIFNIYYAHQKMSERYEGWMNDYNQNKDIYSLTSALRQMRISARDTVISIPDFSNTSLYLMNVKGWTEYTDARLNRGKMIHYNQDNSGIQHSIDKGAGYLIVNGIKNLYTKPYLQSYCHNLTGTYKNVLIFNLKNKIGSFNIERRETEKIYKCSAELRGNDMQNFISEFDSSLFENGTTRSDEFAHSGNYSSRLDANSPYGMTIKLKALKNGESLAITVWRKPTDNAVGGLISSSNIPNPFYFSEYKIIAKEKNGWEKISMEFFVSNELSNQDLTIYAYNPDAKPVFFDDLEIIRYKSVLK